MAYLIVGTAPTMRWLFWILVFVSLSRGTLKSTYRVRFALAFARTSSDDWGRCFQTYPDENPLALDVDVGDGELVGERHVC